MLTEIKCSECGYSFEFEKQSNEDYKIPCPICGATKRNFSVSVKDNIKVSGKINAFVIPASSSTLLMQAVVVPAEKTLEGTLIEAVTIPWFDIVKELMKNPSFAHQLSFEKWEEIIAGAYKKAGFDEVILTPRSGDLGRDVIAIKKGIGSVRVIDQVKAYKPGHLVTANDVRALLGVLQGDKASKGFLTTTSDFAPKIKTDELIKPFIPSKIELINGPELIKRLNELS